MRESVWEEEAASLRQILQDAGEKDIDFSLHYRLVRFLYQVYMDFFFFISDQCMCKSIRNIS